jgi:hypothetical protein
MSDITALAASYGRLISEAGVVFIEYLKAQLPDRTILLSPECHEWTKDLEKTKIGLEVSTLEEGWSPHDTWVTIYQPTLAFKHRYNRKWVKRSIKDPSWLEDMRHFSREHRRGTELHLPTGILRIVDVTRTTYGGRRDGYNDEYLVRFEPCA